jgi:hypothetical protein
MADEFDKLFLTPDEARRLHDERLRKRLAEYLLKMPEDLRVIFAQEFERKKPAPAGGE